MTTTVRHVALCDGSGDFPEPLEATFPGAGLTGPWRLHVHCHLLFVDSRVVLVDTGTGPPWAPAATWFPRTGDLLEALGAEAVSAADVTDVVLTHLHSDHVGWTVHGDPAAPSPTFPNAHHLVQQVELARLSAGTPGQRALHDSHLRPLVDAGLIETVDGAARPLPHVTLVPTPGHTAGHQSVAVDRSDTTLLISGDVFVHPVQVTDPAVGYVYEDDRTGRSGPDGASSPRPRPARRCSPPPTSRRRPSCSRSGPTAPVSRRCRRAHRPELLWSRSHPTDPQCPDPQDPR